MLVIKDLHKSYDTGKSKLHVLKGINLNIGEGEFVSIMGSSGSGKSTLLNIIGILDEKDSGIYELDGIPIEHLSEIRAAEYRSKFLGFIFQSFNLIGYKNALENVALPLYYQDVPRKERNKRAMDYLEKVGLADWATHMPNELSGGQKQRVAIAGILAMSPSIIILDEATSMLDPRGRKEINELVKELKKQNNMTIISITHDIEEAKNADRVILLNKGEIVDCDKPQKILTNEKLLKELKLDIPFSLKIARKLQKKGYQIKDTLDVEELEKQLCQLHAKI